MIDDPLNHSGLGGEVRVRGHMDQVFGTMTNVGVRHEGGLAPHDVTRMQEQTAQSLMVQEHVAQAQTAQEQVHMKLDAARTDCAIIEGEEASCSNFEGDQGLH